MLSLGTEEGSSRNFGHRLSSLLPAVPAFQVSPAILPSR